MNLIEKTFESIEAELSGSSSRESQESENFFPEVSLTPEQYREAVQNKTLLPFDQLVEFLTKLRRDGQGWPGHRRATYQDLIPNVRA